MPRGLKRDDQPYTGGRGTGMGLPFTSLIKQPKLAKQYVAPLGNLNKQWHLAQELEELERQAMAPSSLKMLPLSEKNIEWAIPTPNKDPG
ncbi:hypothetical protein C0991_010468, partial [Blastosporella zonata]